MKKYHRWLTELTDIPTASGREDRVEQWIERFASRRRDVTLSRDKHGNLTLARDKGRAKKPVYFQAHLDHPAFVVDRVVDDRTVEARFRGYVLREYFKGTRVVLHHGKQTHRGVIDKPLDDVDRWLVRFTKDAPAAVGDILTWDVGKARIAGDRLRAPACDDLAAVAAALAAFDQLRDHKHVRLLFTRAEELAFIGTIAACKARSISKAARMICLENSKSFAESPIGGGPIVRVGDRISTFDSNLTYHIACIAEKCAEADGGFKWQRKLMPGGSCEASAFQNFGYTATCLCLPLGNYHNMDESRRRIAAESISVRDFDGLITLLVAVGRGLDQPDQAPPLRDRLDRLFAERRYVLDE